MIFWDFLGLFRVFTGAFQHFSALFLFILPESLSWFVASSMQVGASDECQQQRQTTTRTAVQRNSSASDITSIRHGVNNTNVIINRKLLESNTKNEQQDTQVPNKHSKKLKQKPEVETEDKLDILERIPKKSEKVSRRTCKKQHLKFQQNCCHCRRKQTMQRQYATSVEDSALESSRENDETAEDNSVTGEASSESSKSQKSTMKPRFSRQTSCIQFGLQNNANIENEDNQGSQFSIFNSTSSLATGNSRTISLDALSMLDKLTNKDKVMFSSENVT